MPLEKICKEDFRTRTISYEYMLPDYEPTMKRVMLTHAVVMPNEKAVLDEEITLSGVVEFQMVYQSVEDALARLSFCVPYECTFPADSSAGYQLESVKLASFSCLPAGPRRVLAKGELACSLTCVASEDTPLLSSDADVMTLRESFHFSTHLYSMREEREYAEPILECSSVEPVVLFSTADVEIDEVRPMKDGAFVCGKCNVTALLCEEEGSEHTVIGAIPFEEFLPMGRTLSEGASVRCDGCITSLSLATQSDEEGTHLVANAVLAFSAVATEDEEAELPLDAYSTDCVLDTKFKKQTLVRELASVCHKQTLECSIPKSEGDPCPMGSVIMASAQPSGVTAAMGNGEVVVSLSLEHALLGRDAAVLSPDVQTEESTVQLQESPSEQKTVYVRQRRKTEHSFTVPIKNASASDSCEISGVRCATPQVWEEEDAFVVSTELSMRLVVCQMSEIALCSSFERTAITHPKQKDTLLIVFPDATDTLWSLAKQNHASIPDLLTENPAVAAQASAWDSPRTLDGVDRILLP